MTLNTDWFCMFGRTTLISAPAGGSGCNPSFPTFRAFPGCTPNGTYYQPPHYEDVSINTQVTWMLPDAANLSQFVSSRFPFTDDANPSPNRGTGSSTTLTLNGSIIASHIWDSPDRSNDKGFVWDLNLVALEGSTITVTFQQYKGLNQINDAFVSSLIGSWLRDA